MARSTPVRKWPTTESALPWATTERGLWKAGPRSQPQLQHSREGLDSQRPRSSGSEQVGPVFREEEWWTPDPEDLESDKELQIHRRAFRPVDRPGEQGGEVKATEPHEKEPFRLNLALQ